MPKPGRRVRSSPLVRKIAKENNLDLRQVPGTGSAGRITKEDILGFLAKGGAPRRHPAPKPPVAAPHPLRRPPRPNQPRRRAAPVGMPATNWCR